MMLQNIMVDASNSLTGVPEAFLQVRVGGSLTSSSDTTKMGLYT
jgi:hypothetical protein